MHAYDQADYGQPLVACSHSIANLGSSSARLRLDAPGEATRPYLILGSLSGTGPFVFGGVSIPLTPDAYLSFTAAHTNSVLLPGGFGVLDAAGRGTAAFVIPRALIPSLIGLSARHAFVTFRPDFSLSIASNAVVITVVP